MKKVYVFIKKTVTFLFLIILFFQLVTISYAENIIYRQVSNDNMQIALTFDDGPHPGRTSEILDILEKFNIKATFFPIGENIQNYPDVFNDIIKAGHEIGNHTFSHSSLKNCSINTISEELGTFEKAISKHDCKRTTLIRPPEGSYNDQLKTYAQENNYRIILWSVDTMDWAHKSVEEIVDNVMHNTTGGDIILMHDYISGKSSTREALKIFIPKLIERGFEFVTVSDLIKKSAQE